MHALDTLDWIVISIYFAILFGVAIWVILQKTENTEDYFLAGRNIGWFVVGSSIFASNIGSEHVVGLAGTGAAGKRFSMIMALPFISATPAILAPLTVYVPASWFPNEISLPVPSTEGS